MVHDHFIESKSGVAIIAIFGSNDVLGIYTSSVTAIVAGRTVLRRAFEDTANMTGFAIHFDMPATERESCGEMIESAIFCRLSGYREAYNQYHQSQCKPPAS